MGVIKNTIFATILTSVLAPRVEKRAVVTETVIETEFTTFDVTATVWANDGVETAETDQLPHAATHPTGDSLWGGGSGNLGQDASLTSVAGSFPTISSTVASSASTNGVARQHSFEQASRQTTIGMSEPGPAASATSIIPASQISGTLEGSTNSTGSNSGGIIPGANSGMECVGEAAACTGDITHWDGGKQSNLPQAFPLAPSIITGVLMLMIWWCPATVVLAPHWYLIRADAFAGRSRCLWLERRHELGHDDRPSLSIHGYAVEWYTLPPLIWGCNDTDVRPGNPYCGKSLSIKGTDGNIIQATVGDKCMGCSGFSIDLTDALFTIVAPTGDGRVSGVEWWF